MFYIHINGALLYREQSATMHSLWISKNLWLELHQFITGAKRTHFGYKMCIGRYALTEKSVCIVMNSNNPL